MKEYWNFLKRDESLSLKTHKSMHLSLKLCWTVERELGKIPPFIDMLDGMVKLRLQCIQCLHLDKLIQMNVKLMILFIWAHNNRKTRPCLSDIKWLHCRFVILRRRRGTHKLSNKNRKWKCSVIVWVSVLLRTVAGGGDWRFDNQCGSHHQSQVTCYPQIQTNYCKNRKVMYFLVPLQMNQT